MMVRTHQEEEGNEEAGHGEPGDVALNPPSGNKVGHAPWASILAEVTAEDDRLEQKGLNYYSTTTPEIWT